MGRPTKKTKALLTALLQLISGGGPYELCCAAVGITRETMHQWRQSDPDFETEVEKAAAKGALARLNRIDKHGNKDWHALGWMLERRYPEHFSRPETQLNVTAQAGIINGLNGAAHNTEMVVLADLEFLGLKQHPAYQHEAREIEGVATEVSGTLRREGHGAVIISESAALARKKRYERIHARAVALLERQQKNRGNDAQSDGSRAAPPEPVSQSVPVEAVLKPQESSDAAIHEAVARERVQQMPANVREFFNSEE